jgi:SAM-dependent methyltransferase
VTHSGSPVWLPSPALRSHLNRAATGNPDYDWLSYVRALHLPAALERTLVLGCGSGFLERALIRKDGVGTILAVDADPGQVEGARRQAERAGLDAISYAVLDPESDELPAGPWGVIFATDLLHHVSALERLLDRVRAVLAPGGRFVFFEYVGPSRFQYSDERMELVQRYFRLLPDRLRKDPETGRILWRRERVDAARLSRESPAEAARSQELLALARTAFAAEAEYSGAGGLLHPVLSGLAANFRQGDPEEEQLLRVLCAAEEHLTASGLIEDAFRIFVGTGG